MIQVQDLCIGNWVYDGDRTQFPMYVQTIGEDYVYLDFDGNEGDLWESTPDDLQGIPLTVELLKKIGFEEQIGLTGVCVTWYLYRGKDYRIEARDFWCNTNRKWHIHIDNRDCNSIGGGEVDYIHELQNLVYMTTKQQLKIEL